MLRPADDGGLEAVCGCGDAWLLVFDLIPPDGAPGRPLAVAWQETAVTCDRCGTSHWLTLAPLPEGGMSVTPQEPHPAQFPPREAREWPGGWYTAPAGS
jgi:hypothetical protein